MSTNIQAESPALVTPSEFDLLNSLLTSNQWPEAVPEYLICSDSNEDKFERAVGIIELLSLNLSGKKVLDFGCGEGHLAYEVSHKAAFSLGYDIIKSGNLAWEDGRLTTDWQKVREAGPYDVIVLFDVLDHTQDAVATLEQLREVCTPDAQIYCRLHPWIGPHAAHYYKSINKSYLHLVFTEDEVRQLGIEPIVMQKVYKPMWNYDQWFKAAGFITTYHMMQQIEVPAFFKENALVRSRLPLSVFENVFPDFQMSQVFHDFTLKMSPR